MTITAAAPAARLFYLARLVSAEGVQLASEEVWSPDNATPDQLETFTPAAVALDACAFFNSDEHGHNPGGCTVQLFGPFAVETPAHVFAVADAPDDAADFWTVTPEEVQPDATAEEAARIGGGCANAYLAELLADALARAEKGHPLNALDCAAISEAEDRARENADTHGHDDAGDYYGPKAAEAAREAGYTVRELEPGRWAFVSPDGAEDDGGPCPLKTERDAWDAAGSVHADETADRD